MDGGLAFFLGLVTLRRPLARFCDLFGRGIGFLFGASYFASFGEILRPVWTGNWFPPWGKIFAACWHLFGQGLRRLASFGGERLRLLTSLPTVLTPTFWTGIASLGFFFLEFADCFDTVFLAGDCVARLLFGGETLLLLTSLPTVLTPFFWTGIASLGFFLGGARDFASSQRVCRLFWHFFLDGDCVARLLFGGERLCFFSRVCRLFWHLFLDGDCVARLLFRGRDFASSHEFADCFGRVLRRLASFWERLCVFSRVCRLFWHPFWTGIASLGFFWGARDFVFSRVFQQFWPHLTS